jgi:tetratricopeptide (TPR) repeat protein
MKPFYTNILLGALFAIFMFGPESHAQLNTPRGSQQATVGQRVGITDITVTYSRPAVNGREIYGALVPYGMNDLGFGTSKAAPWRAGANENTTIEFSDAVSLGGQKVAAGTYGFHINIKDADKATVILSKDHTSWGSYFYEEQQDAARIDINTKEIAHKELLTFEFTELKPNNTVLELQWGTKSFPLTIDVAVSEIVLDDIRKKLKNQPGFQRQTWEQAARYALNNDGDLYEALGWADAAIDGQFFSEKNFTNLSLKSQILNKLGQTEKADQVMAEALTMGDNLDLHQYGRQLLGEKNTQKALEIFKMNSKKHKNQWPVNYGLARGYSAQGDYKTATKYLKKALINAPNAASKGRVQANLDKLAKGEDIN